MVYSIGAACFTIGRSQTSTIGLVIPIHTIIAKRGLDPQFFIRVIAILAAILDLTFGVAGHGIEIPEEFACVIAFRVAIA